MSLVLVSNFCSFILLQFKGGNTDMQIYKLPHGEKFRVACVGVQIQLPYDVVAQDFAPKKLKKSFRSQ